MEPGLYAKSPGLTAHSVHHSTLPQPPPFPLVLDFIQFLYRWKDGLTVMNEADCISPGMPRVAFWMKRGLVWCMGMTFSQPPYFSGPRRASNCQLFYPVEIYFPGTPPWLSSLFRAVSLPLLGHDSPSNIWRTSIVMFWSLFSSQSCGLGQRIFQEQCVR